MTRKDPTHKAKPTFSKELLFLYREIRGKPGGESEERMDVRFLPAEIFRIALKSNQTRATAV